ncbi:hypothetical protein AM1_1600 [Acaryochloris marina MBIC11017]|uniref:Uncharacterized protein n=1 Tax=Acaryochloris marina (strain MBIC 11017) TaxID=329726 RepID=B0CA37_ACAM1|nr:hypothetical protein AM1_1600 [Acaryochloris marina MBIC11017]
MVTPTIGAILVCSTGTYTPPKIVDNDAMNQSLGTEQL